MTVTIGPAGRSYTLPVNSFTNAASGTVISPSDANASHIDLATGINTALAYAQIDGQRRRMGVQAYTATPPGSPADGQVWLVATGGAGVFAGKDKKFAAFLSASWFFFDPLAGDEAVVVASRQSLIYDASGTWQPGNALAGANADITALSGLTTPLSVAQGGTAGNTAATARSGIGAAALGANSDITSLSNLSTPLSVAQGGTGANSVAATTAALGVNAVNLIINGAFQINQRNYVSAAAISAAAFGHDRWKAGAGGCTYTFSQLASTTIITITAGTLTQVIEGNNIAGGVYTLSWSGTATARVYQGSPTGSYVASPLTTASLTADTNTIVEFSTGGSSTLGNVQFQAGSVASPFVRRPFAIEETLCLRYFEKSYGRASAPGSAPGAGNGTFLTGVSGNLLAQNVTFRAAKRAVPTVIIYDNAGASNKISWYNGSIWQNGGTISVQFSFENDLYIQATASPMIFISFDYTASSEL